MKQQETHLETGGAPVYELDSTLRLDHAHGGIRVLGDDITAVEQAAGPKNVRTQFA
jgi:hypothetical protein